MLFMPVSSELTDSPLLTIPCVTVLVNFISVATAVISGLVSRHLEAESSNFQAPPLPNRLGSSCV